MNASQLPIDSEDLNLDILPAIEESFSIQFSTNDFHAGFTYGELCQLVASKLPAATADDCTTQQAFYKLRQALKPLLEPAADIKPSSRLDELLPTRRRELAARLDAALSIKIQLLTMPVWVEIGGIGLLLAAMMLVVAAAVGCLNKGDAWAIHSALLALGCFGLSIGLFSLGARFGQRLRLTTVRELAEYMSSRHYRQSRRQPATANPREVVARLNALFIDMTSLETTELIPEAIF